MTASIGLHWELGGIAARPGQIDCDPSVIRDNCLFAAINGSLALELA